MIFTITLLHVFKVNKFLFLLPFIPHEDQNKTWPRGSPDEYTVLAAFVLT